MQEYYNPSDVLCDFPERVDCGDRPVCDANNENCFEVTTEPPNFCDMITCTSDGWVPEGECERCTCECSQGRPYELCCQDGLVWNYPGGPINPFCDFPANVGECKKRGLF